MNDYVIHLKSILYKSYTKNNYSSIWLNVIFFTDQKIISITLVYMM